MKVCIIGGGNIGTAAAAIIKNNRHDVFIKTSKPQKWQNTIVYTDMNTQDTFTVTLDAISSEPSLVEDADIVLITAPSYSLNSILDEIKPYLKLETPIGVIPGTGGVEFYCKDLIEKGYIVFGLDRVPCIARVVEYGESVQASKKESVRLSCLPKHKTNDLCKIVEKLFDLECKPLSNYLTVTFTPSNPILHTARLYALYNNSAPNYYWDRNIPFYAEWNDESSEMLIACDNELQRLCKAIQKLDLSGVVPLTKHYESDTVEKMTNKISGISSLKNISSPMIIKDNHYILDINSRYFTEDFAYGLCIIKGFAEIFDCQTPNIDKILWWFQQISGQNYFTPTGFNGFDLKSTAIPQNFGIKTKEDVYALYK